MIQCSDIILHKKLLYNSLSKLCLFDINEANDFNSRMKIISCLYNRYDVLRKDDIINKLVIMTDDDIYSDDIIVRLKEISVIIAKCDLDELKDYIDNF